jgi:serine/threonine-protein kinase
MAPEQARGEDVDQRSDIWALCIVLYEAMTGRLPFDGKSYNALLRSIIEDTPAPITNFASGDPELWAVLEKGLAKEPDQRWQSMREIGGALARWLLDLNVHEDIAGASLHAAWFHWRKPSDSPSLPPSEPSFRRSGAFAPDTPDGPAYAAWPAPPSSDPRSSAPEQSSFKPPASGSMPSALASTLPPATRSSGFGSRPPEARPSLLDIASAGPPSRAWRALVLGLVVALVGIGGLTAFLLSRSEEPAELPQATPPPAAPATTVPAAAVEPATAAPAAPPAEPVTEPPPPTSASPVPTAGTARKSGPPALSPRTKTRAAPRATKPAATGDLDIKTQF